MRRPTSQSGFTAVELLITLFVAAAFLVAGYQLFNLVIKDGGNTRVESAASNVAYDYLRRYSDSAATNPCTPSTPLANTDVTVEGTPNAKVSVSITCPQDDAPSLSKVDATVTYGLGTDANTVKYATYIDKSKGATPNGEVTNGLIGWWRLNNNANSSAGSLNGTTNATAPGVGQNGQGANAFLFNGSSSYILVPFGSDKARPTASYTITAWIRVSSLPAAEQKILSTTESGGHELSVGGTSSTCSGGKISFTSWTGGSYKTLCSTAGSITTNTWTFVSGVYTGASENIYINGTLDATLAVSGAMTYSPADSVPLCIGAEPDTSGCNGGNMNGLIDDVRFYSRALSASEITQLYNGGAK